jgi:WD40 repeat protein
MIARSRLWDVTDIHSPAQLATMTGHTDVVASIAFSPNMKTLLTDSYDHTARLWDITDTSHSNEIAMLTGHPGGRQRGGVQSERQDHGHRR